MHHRRMVNCFTVILYGLLLVGYGHSRGVPSDKLEETRCEENQFRCNDGRCIDAAFACDGTEQCKDASDERVIGCKTLSSGSGESDRKRVARATGDEGSPGCVVPPQLKNGKWKLHHSFCDGDEDCSIPQGLALQTQYQLVYACKPGSKMMGNPNVICQASGNWSPIPSCVESSDIKCHALFSDSRTASCFHPDKDVNCDDEVPAGTEVRLHCRGGYKEDISSTVIRRDKIECGSTGEWSAKPIICVPSCGVVTSRQRPPTINGSMSAFTDLPWQASVYKKEKDSSRKKFICGATIIHTKIVLTSARCVFDERSRTTMNPSMFYIAAGNVINDYDSPRHDKKIVQKSQVLNIYTHCPYHGKRSHYEADIALLEMRDPFECSSYLLPACLDTSGFGREIYGSGSVGKVSGFGVQEDVSKAVLETINVPYATYDECRKSRQKSEEIHLITNDKLCTAPINGTSDVCEGDLGSGLVFQKNKRWYAMGVVSVSSKYKGQSCDKYDHTLYTKVNSYVEWIQDVLYALEYNEYSSPCDLDCSPVNSDSTTTLCNLSGRWVPCEDPVPPKTKARTTCSFGYEKRPGGPETSECKANGHWDPEPNPCLPASSSSDISDSTITISRPPSKSKPSEPSNPPDLPSSVPSSSSIPESIASESTAPELPATFEPSIPVESSSSTVESKPSESTESSDTAIENDDGIQTVPPLDQDSSIVPDEGTSGDGTPLLVPPLSDVSPADDDLVNENPIVVRPPPPMIEDARTEANLQMSESDQGATSTTELSFDIPILIPLDELPLSPSPATQSIPSESTNPDQSESQDNSGRPLVEFADVRVKDEPTTLRKNVSIVEAETSHLPSLKLYSTFLKGLLDDEILSGAVPPLIADVDNDDERNANVPSKSQTRMCSCLSSLIRKPMREIVVVSN